MLFHRNEKTIRGNSWTHVIWLGIIWVPIVIVSSRDNAMVGRIRLPQMV